MLSVSTTRLWKQDENQKWELYSNVEDIDTITTSKDTQNPKDSKGSQDAGSSKKQKPSAQVFYISKVKQEVKGSMIYTPKGYGIIQNILPDSNTITVKVNNEISEFDRNEVSNEILIEFIHVQAGAKRIEKISFPIQSTGRDISERIMNENSEAVYISRLFYKGKELPQTSENLEKLGITPASKILVVSSFGKFYTINRFKQVYNGWGFGYNTFEGISFSASKDCRIAGVGIYTSYQKSDVPMQVTIKLIQGQSKDGATTWETEASIAKSEDENDKICKVMLDRPVMIKANEIWSFVAEIKISNMKSSLTYYGNSGLASVTGEAEVTFTFLQCNGQINQTNVYSGQLPEIYYYA